MPKAAEVKALIKKHSPLMDESSELFRELEIFFGEQALIATDFFDLQRFLERKRLYRVLRLKGASFKECAYQLIDDNADCLEALGMLRYYKSSAPIKWEEVEAAETVMGKELPMTAYGWAPDAWTAIKDDNAEPYELVVLLAFDYGD